MYLKQTICNILYNDLSYKNRKFSDVNKDNGENSLGYYFNKLNTPVINKPFTTTITF